MYPELSPKERENKIVREHGTVFVMQIGKRFVRAHAMTAERPTTTIGS